MQGIRFKENVIELFYFDLVLKSKKYLSLTVLKRLENMLSANALA